MYFIHTVVEPSHRLSPDLLCSPNWNPVSMKPLQHLVSTIILFLLIWLQRSPTCRIIQFLFFFDWLISLNIISLRFTHVAWSQNFLPFKGYSIARIGHIVFVHLSADGRLSWSHVLAVVNMNVQMPICASASNLLCYVLRNGITGSYASSVLNSLRTFCTIVAIWFYSSTNSAQGLLFLHIFSSFCCFLFFW